MSLVNPRVTMLTFWRRFHLILFLVCSFVGLIYYCFHSWQCTNKLELLSKVIRVVKILIPITLVGNSNDPPQKYCILDVIKRLINQSRLVKTGRNWSKLVETGQNCQNWLKLVMAFHVQRPTGPLSEHFWTYFFFYLILRIMDDIPCFMRVW